MLKTFKIAAAVVASTILLAGCASKPQTYAFDAVKITQMPSWDKSSIATLEKEGWSFTVTKFADESQGLKNLPDVIYGFNKDETCTLEFNSAVDLPTNETLGDRFNTQNYIIKYIQSSMSKETMTAKITEAQINVKDSNNKMAVSESLYDAPFYSGGIDTSAVVTDGVVTEPKMPEQTGTIHNYLMARSLTANYLDNPLYELNKDQKNARTEPKGTATLSVIYKCLNNSLDSKVIDTIKKDATIIIK